MGLRHRDLHPVQAKLDPGDAPRSATPSPPRTSRRARRPAAARPAAPCAAACAARPGRRAARSRSPPRTHRSPAASAAHTPYAAAGPHWPAPGAPYAGARDASRPDPGPTTRLSRLICSNSSTLDRAIPDLRIAGTDVQIASRARTESATTRCPHQAARSPPRRSQIREEQQPSRGQLR
jgi:hypothetical protein